MNRKVNRAQKKQKVKNATATNNNENSVEENDECGSCGYKYWEPNDPLIKDDRLACVRKC